MRLFSTLIFTRLPITLSLCDPKIIQKLLIFENIEVQRPPLKNYCFRAAFWIDLEASELALHLFSCPQKLFY